MPYAQTAESLQRRLEENKMGEYWEDVSDNLNKFFEDDYFEEDDTAETD